MFSAPWERSRRATVTAGLEFVPHPAIELKDSRHPVVERMGLERGFVPNDVTLDSEDKRFMIITGPNMSGKSTLIRQVALISLMAQMGSFVPAQGGPSRYSRPYFFKGGGVRQSHCGPVNLHGRDG